MLNHRLLSLLVLRLSTERSARRRFTSSKGVQGASPLNTGEAGVSASLSDPIRDQIERSKSETKRRRYRSNSQILALVHEAAGDGREPLAEAQARPHRADLSDEGVFFYERAIPAATQRAEEGLAQA